MKKSSIIFLKKDSKNLGFTLIEMIVVVGIITVLLATVLFNFRDFDSKSVLKNLAYETALTIREAQSYGLGVKRYVTEDGGNLTNSFVQSYGVQFNDGLSENKFVYLFTDAGEENGICDDCLEGECQQVSSGECKTVLELHSDSIIDEVCFYGIREGIVSDSEDEVLPGDGQCFSETGGISQAAVRFKRPNPDAKFTVNTDSIESPSLTSTTFGTLVITLRKNKIADYVQNIEVTTLGQVRVYGKQE